MAVPMWECIYDPLGDEGHMKKRWIGEKEDRAGHWVHYEPYGRNSAEKIIFIDSINSEHHLWSSDQEEKTGTRLKFSRDIEVYKEDGGEMTEERMCSYDRDKKESCVFAQMLGSYVEKHKSDERPNFFNSPKTKKWTEDKDLMKRIGPNFKETNRKFREIPNYRLALGDISVKSYPRHYFLEVCDLYLDYMDSLQEKEEKAEEKKEEKKEEKSKLNPNANVFIPKQFADEPPSLVRQGPKKICGTYLIETAPKPKGSPEKVRPKSSSSSTTNLCWEMKGESDRKIKDLENKLDLLIQLNSAPIIQAQEIYHMKNV